MSRSYERLLESELIHSRAELGEVQTQLEELTAERAELQRQLGKAMAWVPPYARDRIAEPGGTC